MKKPEPPKKKPEPPKKKDPPPAPKKKGFWGRLATPFTAPMKLIGKGISSVGSAIGKGA